MTTPIDDSQDVIDSRDVINRIRALERQREFLRSAIFDRDNEIEDLNKDNKDTEAVEKRREEIKDALQEWEERQGRELETLRALAEEAEPLAVAWELGAQLVRFDYLGEFARELAESRDDLSQWPYRHIDWRAATAELKQGYKKVYLGNCPYYLRDTGDDA